MDLLEQSLLALEWPIFLKHYSEHCQSAPAKELALHVIPAALQADAEELLSLSTEARILLTEASFTELGALTNLESTLRRLAKSLVLDGKELYAIYHLMHISALCKDFILNRRPKPGQECPRISQALLAQENFSKLEPRLLACLEPDGSVKDSASPRLRELKQEERRLHNEARERLDAVLQKAFRDGHLQDRFFDYRDGRYLIPVKSEHRNRLPGLVVESSSSHATVFMEPASVRECNDRLKQVLLEIEDEIYQILAALSAYLEPYAAALKLAYAEILQFDLTMARARMADYYNSVRGATVPTFDETVELEGLYHPLLPFVIPADRIVRSNLILKSRVLIISGPNTGGKTVLLKSLGLCSLMARAGFYLPCAGTTRLPFFTTILAQIGDAQNLELSLSSFSGSVLSLKSILELGGQQSLVLIDEILHATDPDEATALARAILEELEARGSFAVVTTHLNGLKVAFSDERFTSASMEFNEQELKPTYRLRIGIPGSSRALEIGERLGLDKRLIGKARSYLQSGQIQLQELVDKISAQERKVASEQEHAERLRSMLQEESERSRKLTEQLENQKRTIRESLLNEFKALERESLIRVEEVIHEYREKIQDINSKHASSLESKKRIQEIREKFSKTQKNLESQLPSQKATETPSQTIEFRQNGQVYVRSMKTMGILLSDPANRKRPAEVLLGKMKMQLAWDQLSARATPDDKKSRPITIRSEVSDCPPELYLLGKTGDEATDLVQLYLDRAVRSGRPSVRIVHGLGNGVLRRVVREILKNSPYEVKFRPGQGSEGGEGCTVVEFT